MSLPGMNFLHLTVSELQPRQTISHSPPANPPTHPDTMSENNTLTALKGCGVKTGQWGCPLLHKFCFLIFLEILDTFVNYDYIKYLMSPSLGGGTICKTQNLLQNLKTKSGISCTSQILNMVKNSRWLAKIAGKRFLAKNDFFYPVDKNKLSKSLYLIPFLR